MNQYAIPGLFFAGTLLLGYMYLTGPNPVAKPTYEVKQSSGSTVNYNDLQKLKHRTATRLDLEREKAILDKRKSQPRMHLNRNTSSKTYEIELSDGPGPAAQDVETSETHGSLTLDQRMDAFLAKRQEYEELEQASRQIYVDTFIAEALKMGFVVTVDDNMEILSVTKAN